MLGDYVLISRSHLDFLRLEYGVRALGLLLLRTIVTTPHLSDGCVLGFVYYLRAPHLTEVKVYAPILGWF